MYDKFPLIGGECGRFLRLTAQGNYHVILVLVSLTFCGGREKERRREGKEFLKEHSGE